MKTFTASYDILGLNKVESQLLEARSLMMNIVNDEITRRRFNIGDIMNKLCVERSTAGNLRLGMVSQFTLEDLLRYSIILNVNPFKEKDNERMV